MSKLMEIRWHGRGGQGSKTASILLGKVASDAGMHIQAFPEYGPERMGAPVLAYNRISDEKLTLHCQISEPQIVVVLDPTLLNTVDVTDGIQEDGIILVNSDKEPSVIREQLNYKGGSVFTVDANKISDEELGRVIPNAPMLGALVKVSGTIDHEVFVEMIHKEFHKKFSDKKEIIAGNLKSIERAYQEVKGE